MTDQPATETTDAVRLEQRIAAPPETVFEFLVDPEKLVRWLGTEADIEPEPGGRLWLNVTGDEKAERSYVEVDPPRRVSFTWGWLDSEDVPCDLAITRNVTYFVGPIVRFVEKMTSAARRRVIIAIQSVPPPNQSSPLFQLVYGEQQVLVPGHQELLPVLWEMDILPDVYVMHGSPDNTPLKREEAVISAMEGIWLAPKDQDRARSIIEANFDKLYEVFGEGFRNHRLFPFQRGVIG